MTRTNQQTSAHHLHIICAGLALVLAASGTMHSALVLAQDAADGAQVTSKEGDLLHKEGAEAYKKGNISRSAQLWEQARNVYAKELGPDHPNTLGVMYNLAIAYYVLDRHAEALKLGEETLVGRRAKLGPDHPDTLNSMNNLAVIYGKDFAHHNDALKMRTEIVVRTRTKLGSNHPATLLSMEELAYLYRTMGRPAEALKLHQDVLAIRVIKFGLGHPGTLSGMSNLAVDYFDLGRHSEALKLQEKTLTLMRAKLGPSHILTLRSMSNLAASYRELGRFNEALKLDEETFRLRREKLGSAHFETIESMLNLAATYYVLGRYSDAMTLQEDTLVLQRRALGINHPSTLSNMKNLALTYDAIGRHAEALKLKEEALVLRTTKFGPDHPSTLGIMDSLATSYLGFHRYADAVKLNEKALAVRREKLGQNHPDTLQSMNNLAVAYHAANRRGESLALRRESLTSLDQMWESMKGLTREERGTAFEPYQRFYTLFARYLAESPGDFSEAFTVVERGKARSLLEELTARQAISSSGIPEEAGERLREILSQIEFLDGKLAAAPNDSARQSLRGARDAAKVKLDTLRRDLIAQYPRYAALSAVKTVTVDQGRALLPNEGVFISWLFDGKLAGVALALPKTGDLKVLKISPGPELAVRAETFRWLHALPDTRSFVKALHDVPLAAWQEKGVLHIGNPDSKPAQATAVPASAYERLRLPAMQAHGQWLTDQLLKPLAAQIGEANQWILSPDGVLATLPWDTLPWNGKSLGEQKQITVIQSLSVYQLLKDREGQYSKERAAPSVLSQPLLAIGDASYSPSTTQRCGVRSPNFRRAPKYIAPPTSKAASEQQHEDAYRQMLSLVWDNLPCTQTEVAKLNELMGGKKLLGKQASEATLRQLSQDGELTKYRNLHFAAHGYLNTSFPNLSALVLTRTGNDEKNDGFITAGEWPAFNLKSDLLVMSACETALGKIVSGEGVQGLPYALYVAGNRDTVLSLWQVSDEGTSVFMKRFWGKLKQGQSHSVALSETKREMQRGAAGKAYSDPYYWAPFVLYGLQE